METVSELMLLALLLLKRKETIRLHEVFCEAQNSTVDEILSYNDILDHIEKDNNDIDNDTGQLYKFHRINAIKAHFGHQTRIIKDQHTMFL
jgi:hypothetical protein